MTRVACVESLVECEPERTAAATRDFVGLDRAVIVVRDALNGGSIIGVGYERRVILNARDFVIGGRGETAIV